MKRARFHLIPLCFLMAWLAGPAAAEQCSGQPAILAPPGWAPVTGGGLRSHDFAPTADGGAFDTEAADDFMTPAGEIWWVEQVKIQLGSSDSLRPLPAAVNVTVSGDGGGKPGQPLCTYSALTGLQLRTHTNGLPFLEITLPSSCQLCANTRFWLSVQALGQLGSNAQYSWTWSASRSGSPAVWRNPGGGYGTSCSQWGAAATQCGQGSVASQDLSFALVGRIQSPAHPESDFNGDACPDLVLQRRTSTYGTLPVKIWLMNGATKIRELDLVPSPAAPLRVVAAEDFDEDDGDLTCDLALQNPSEGTVRFWSIKEASAEAELVVVDVPGQPPYARPERKLVAAGRFMTEATVNRTLAGGGGSNLVCMGDDGGIIIWRTGPVTFVNLPSFEIPYPGGDIPSPGQVSNSNWRLRAATDLNGDGYPDLAFYNLSSGRVVTWNMTYAEPVGLPAPERLDGTFLNPMSPADAGRAGTWELLGGADFGMGPDGPDVADPTCGVSDLVFQEVNSGEILIWFLNGNRQRTGELLMANPLGSDWMVVAPH